MPKTYQIKELAASHLTSEFFATLEHLSKTVKPDIAKAKKTLKLIRKNPNHKIFVAVDKRNMVVGLITLVIEQKFIHRFGKMSHIEDVVVREGFEGQGIGGALVKQAICAAEKAGCYRIRLFCSDRNVKFYARAGFFQHENGMQLDL
ncbi:MAG: GNAT family N-acetyltransferase [Patescibacteria group bacterium]|jgi:predicted N-acetyltransferase YhbS